MHVCLRSLESFKTHTTHSDFQERVQFIVLLCMVAMTRIVAVMLVSPMSECTCLANACLALCNVASRSLSGANRCLAVDQATVYFARTWQLLRTKTFGEPSKFKLQVKIVRAYSCLDMWCMSPFPVV